MWNRVNQVVRGVYMGVPYRGVVGHSRVKLGGTVQHAVDLFDDISVFGSVRSAILIDETDDFSVDCEHFRDYSI